MPPPSRFGASKYRNAVLSTPAREEWYRHSLPPSSSSGSSSSISTFSSEIKANREWIITLTPNGDLSYRGYDTIGSSGSVGTAKVGGGGGVGDWDLGVVESEHGWELVVGGLDGVITVYSLPSLSPTPGELNTLLTIPSFGSTITNLCLHPTTPSLLLTSSTSAPLTIYDLTSGDAAIILQLPAPDPKGMWSIAWSPNGRLVGGITRKGICYIWEPRASSKPIASRQLPIQPLKPAKMHFIGKENQIFVTAFSKTRDRQYSLFNSASSSSPLSTIFTTNVDTNPTPLLSVVDESRELIYVGGRGDMTIRQIELTGSQGFQETLHALSQLVVGNGLALIDPTRLDVMSAEIGRLLVEVCDKDGEGLVPFSVKVPRRQLLDFHEDLFPDVLGSFPEQSAKEWLEGGDKAPLRNSLDPSRRRVWEKQLEERAANRTQAPKKVALATPVEGQGRSEAVIAAPASSATIASKSDDAASKPAQLPTSSSPDPSLPKVQDGESYSSTSYKIRIVGQHLSKQLELHRSEGKKGPLMVGLQGPQGCGKTTLCDALLGYLREEPRNLQVAVLSLDDLYRTHDGLKELAATHPENALLFGRGPPGTHDVDLATSVLEAVTTINDSEKAIDLPIFDKSSCGGEGDRSSDTVKVKGPLDVFILEGWSMGFPSLPQSDLETLYNSSITSKSSINSYLTKHPLKSLMELNTYLEEFSSKVYKHFETIVQIQPTSFENVFKWRLEQERNMKAKNGGRGMSDEQVVKFVERYMPCYEIWSEGVWRKGMPWTGKGLRVWFGEDREVIKVEFPEGLIGTGRAGGSKDALVDVRVTSDRKPTSVPTSVVPERQEQATIPSTVKIPTSSSISPQTSSTLSMAPTPTPSTTQTTTKPFNPTYSRKFLAAKSPLMPTYDSLPPLASLHQDSLVLKSTASLAFFPIQGPGGRLGVHPLSKKGRMTVGGEGFLSGGVEIVDFAVEPFRDAKGVKVVLAGEDGVLRGWRVGHEGVKGVGPEPEMVLKGKGIDKISQIVFHPTAKDLLVAVTSDQDKPHLHFFDLSSGLEVKNLGIEANGIFNLSFSPGGDKVAIATKNNQIIVLDPRQPSSTLVGKAHDSPRSFQIAWIDQTHLISVGFSKGSQRKINLYQLPSTLSGTIEMKYSITIDVSPAVLFPHYDPDTRILYIWGKGERQIQAYEINLNALEPISKLPSYTSGSPQVGVSFFSKRMVDVRKVEVLKCLRLSAKSLEEVTFSIPRNKPEFFQDDIYVPTDDVETSTTTVGEWLEGRDVAFSKIDLAPDGMTRLSQAPQSSSKVKTKFVPAADILTEEEKKRREMDDLFRKAKLEESSSDEEKGGGGGLDPPDDDW